MVRKFDEIDFLEAVLEIKKSKVSQESCQVSFLFCFSGYVIMEPPKGHTTLASCQFWFLFQSKAKLCCCTVFCINRVDEPTAVSAQA